MRLVLILTTDAYAVRYAPGLMERVSERRGMEVVGCMVASPTHPLGAWLTITGPTGTRLRCRVTDTSQPRDRARHIRTKRIEVDYKSGFVLCGQQWQGKASECPVSIDDDGTTENRD